MKRSAYAGLVLVSGFVLATAWLASSDCEGKLCFGSKAELETAVVTAPQDPVRTEDLERIWKESEPAQSEPARSEPALTETEAASEDLATADQAGAGLEARWEAHDSASVDNARAVPESRRQAPDLSQVAFTDPQEPDSLDEEPETVAPVNADYWEMAAFNAINEPNDELRAEAIGDVGLLHGAGALAALTDVAFADPVADNRYMALESLWASAGDNLDVDSAIRSAFREALNDPDERIAELAEKALKDLAKLEKQHEQEEF